MIYQRSAHFIQTGPSRWTDEAEAKRLGLRRYVTPARTAAAAAPKRAPAASGTPSKGRVTLAAIDYVSAARDKGRDSHAARRAYGELSGVSITRATALRDIPDAMARGMSNAEIHDLIARGVIRRPRLDHAQLDP